MLFVVKFGGSLLTSARDVLADLVRVVCERGWRVILVPGGGVFADVVRDVDSSLGLSKGAAHWMAVLGMEQYALFLCDGTGAVPVKDCTGEERAGVFVLFPSGLLQAEGDNLGIGWHVTSDTIAAWVAHRLGLNSFVKATDVEGVFLEGDLAGEVRASILKGVESCVDRALPYFLLEHSMNCRVVYGGSVESIVCALEGRGGSLIRGC